MATRWLVGMMGAGKSTIGRLVAARLGVRFVDTDEVLQVIGGRSIASWLTDDPSGFRAAEEEVVAEIAGTDAVVACGGGVVTSARSRRLLRESGTAIWLRADVGVLADRVGDDAGRPLLAGDPEAALQDLMAEREAWYAEVAEREIDVGRAIAEVVEEVIDAWTRSS